MSKVMILGAGIYQVPLIKAAKKRGFEVVVTSIPGNYPGFKLADSIQYADTTDEQAVLSIAKEEKVQGICTAGTDVALKSLGKVVDVLGLTGISYEAAVASSDKLVMKQRFENAGVLTARYRVAASLEDCYSIFEELNQPVVFKVLDSSGSRGVITVNEQSEIPEVYDEIMATTKADKFIIEEFITGLEFGIQAFIQSGKLLFALPHGDVLHRDKKTVPVGHYVPFEKEIANLESILLEAIKALGMDNCAINADLILCNDQVYFLELAARAGATCLPELVSWHYGIDYYDLILASAMEVSHDYNFREKNAAAAEIITSPSTGTYKGYQPFDTPFDDVIDFSMDYAPGEKVKKFEVGPDRIGQVVVKGKSLEDAIKNLNHFKKELKLSIDAD